MSEQRFRLLVESVRDYAIFMLEADGTVATWNAGAERIKGWKAEEIIGRHFSVFYTEADRRSEKPKRELAVAMRVGKYEEEGWRVRQDGSQFWASVVISAIRAEDGELLGFSKVTRDLTERRAQDLRLQTAVAELSKSNRELEEYASFVSHDLQEPLRKMASFAELLRAKYADKLGDDANKYIAVIVDGAARMRKLITDVLDYSRIGREAVPMGGVELSEVIALVLKDLDLAVADASAKIETGELPLVWGNRDRLVRIFQNLILNALKYREPSRPLVVRIGARSGGGDAVIFVRDNGIGFRQEQAETIMRPFQRLHTKERYPGSGIGLAAAKKIAELHQGRIWAESKPDEGSTFFVSLPKAAP
jgi:PAS domain S-box-containing protein